MRQIRAMIPSYMIAYNFLTDCTVNMMISCISSTVIEIVRGIPFFTAILTWRIKRWAAITNDI